MKPTFFGLLFAFVMLGTQVSAQDLGLKYSSRIKASEKKVLEEAMAQVAALLPPKMIENLPPGLEIKVASLSNHKSIPDEVCVIQKNGEEVATKNERPFVYGLYNELENVLTINTPVLLELQKGKENSKRITCQHKSLYDQAIATIIHELTHAYDYQAGRVSSSIEYINRAGFKRGLLKIKSKNIQAMRSADSYELKNVAESFAVNMEYYTMDPEFMCRKPSMFAFFKNHFGFDPFPNRSCGINNIVMMSTNSGFIPTVLDTKRVYRIDYLLASPGKEIMSGFGHSMFRLIVCAPERLDPITNKIIPATPMGKKCLEDKLYHIVVSYRANVEDATLNYFKGLFGGYPSMLFILSFSDVLDEYNRDELRDVMSHPLLLSQKEKEDFITRVKEEHWNYRGSYKFVNNNCAVESYDLLKSALDRSQLQSKSSLTPNGVLEDLDKLQFLSMKSDEMEVYKSKTDQVMLAYKKAYGFTGKGSEKEDKKALQKFIDESKPAQRLKIFEKFKKAAVDQVELNEEIHMLKDKLVQASSFSVMEQHILRASALKYRKKAADMFMTSEDPKIKDLIKDSGSAFSQSFTTLSKNGYGIPFANEMVSSDEMKEQVDAGKEVMAKIEVVLKEAMPEEYAALELMNENIKIYNNYSLKIRKEFRSKLDLYVGQVLKNLSRNDYTRETMIKAAQGDGASLKKVRELLGEDLVTEKEILDVKLKRLIAEFV